MTIHVQQRLTVAFSFPVVFTRGVFDPGNDALAGVMREAVAGHPDPRALLFVDDALAAAFPGFARAGVDYLATRLPRLRLMAAPIAVAGGEAGKADPAGHERLLAAITGARLDRHSFVLIAGGGAVLDTVGFAASLVHRGIRVVRLPSTVLAQNDGGVGVKTAINGAGEKNLYGTFAPPFAVVNDLDLLAGLAEREARAGLAEAFKVALIRDAAFYRQLLGDVDRLAARDPGAVAAMVVRCAELHLQHMRDSGDPFEQGVARPLDFGHWSAHHLEVLSAYRISHGDAVAIGILLDLLYAAGQGWVAAGEPERLAAALRRIGFPLWHDPLAEVDASGRPLLFTGLDRFREHLGGRLCLTMPDGIGAMRDVHAVDEAAMVRALATLRALAETAGAVRP